MQEKKGISLIVLVITIIVMIVLAGAIILSLNNAGIIQKANEAVKKTDEATVKELAQMAWGEAYASGIRHVEGDDGLKAKVDEALYKNGIEADDYFVLVKENGVEVYDWKESVSQIVDGVPIPKGFVASPYSDENKKDTGLVIYELNNNETAISSQETQFESWTERNQYVWIPVDRNQFTTQFVRDVHLGGTIEDYKNIGTSKAYWELEVDSNNMPKTKEQTSDYLDNGKLDYITEETLKEARAMYESIKKYGGFYIARYEAGLDIKRKYKDTALVTGSNVYSMMNKIPYTHIAYNLSEDNRVFTDDGGALEVARSIYPNDSSNTTGVISTLIYGVQYDRMVAWLEESKAKDINGIIINIQDVTNYGNHLNMAILKNDLNKGAKRALIYGDSIGNFEEVTQDMQKDSETPWVLSTGALMKDKFNNIYDLSGNLREWAMTAYGVSMKARRSNYYNLNTDKLEVEPSGIAHAAYYYVNTGYNYMEFTFRSALYIK